MPSADEIQPEPSISQDVDASRTITETDISPPRGNPFPVVGVGASAGGLEAFEQFLSGLSEGTGMAFVLVQHLDPLHESMLAEILRLHCKMPVITVHDKMTIAPDHVYVIPPNTSMILEDGHLRLAAREEGLHLPIDRFFRSLAKVQGSRAIGVVLSGNASDGSLGLRAIKAECGMTFAQEEASARFSGMPRNAIATGAVDFVLTPEEIARQLVQLRHHPFLVTAEPGRADTETLPDGDGDLKRILALLHGATKVDFSHYKHTTIRRRMGRRMMVLRNDNLAEYARYCEQHPAELGELYRDLLISVTNFFRDPEVFEALGKLLGAALTERAQPDQPVRVWVPGCATGEEVYSYAISIHEALEEHQLSAPLQIFGTDISEMALERARQGIYSEAIKQDVSPTRLSRFFTKIEGGYQISKGLRESCIFARHDVTKDAPFSHLDLVSCRNVLIYLDGKLHNRLFPLFHYALNPGGLLVLGSAESAATAPDLFTPVENQQRIYRRRPVAVRLSLDQNNTPAAHGSTAATISSPPAGSDLQKRVDRIMQSKYGPAAVLVDAELRIVQFRGHTSPFLDPKPGEASLNLLHMARENLVVPLRRSIKAAAEQKFSVRESDILLDDPSLPPRLTLEVSPISDNSPAERYYLIAFLPQADVATGLSPETAPPGMTTVDSKVGHLERELAETREYLRNLTEDYEAHSEELRAANEEARSANEELQSANEELGTTKEELQSTNEELTTVNEELQNRNQELTAINSDLKNLLGAVSLGILMIDQDLRVRRFNTAAEKLFELSTHDMGRRISHIHGRIDPPKLEQQVKTVIESLRVLEEELQDVDGRWYSMTIRPYRTLDNHIAGAVVTLQDIDPLKRGLEAAEGARNYAEGMIETVREPLIVLDSDLRVQRATAAFYETFLVSREETEGRLLYDLGNGQWNQPRLRELLGSALFRHQPFHDYEIEHDLPHIGRRTMRLNARRIPMQDPNRRMLLLAIEDVTERREEAEIRYQRLFEAAKDGMILVDAETEAISDVNPYFLQLTGFAREDVVGRPFGQAPPFLEIPEVATFVAVTKDSEMIKCDDVPLITQGRGNVWVDLTANRYEVGTQPMVQFNIRDITERKEAARALRETEERFRLFVESVRDYALFQLDTQGLIVAWNSGAERLLGWHEEEIIGKPADIVFVPEDVERGEAKHELETARALGRSEHERWHMRKDGSRFFASGVLTQVRDENDRLRGFAKIMRDVTESKEQEEELRSSVKQKTMLVREIHHRVKNNLQVIVSLLSLQSHQINKPELLAAFEETEARVRAIAKIHERLYASDDLTEVEFGTYLTHLSNELVALFATVPDTVKLAVNVQEMVLHIEQAIPLGLIANELIINALKHGLKGTAGKLEVSLSYVPEGVQPELGQTLDDGWGQVRISDTGSGFPASTDLTGSSSMGFRLVNLLVRQLRAKLEVRERPGADIIITFPLAYR